MLVRLLGATSVRRGDGEWSPIGSRAVRSLLAGLATHPNTTVSIDTLTGWVWGEDLPARPQAALQTVASRLRTILREALPDTSTSTSTSSVAVEAVPGGYLLRIDPDLIDATRFETLLRHARTTTRTEHPPAAIARYDEALALWDGDHALIDSTPTTYAHTEAARLNELRLTAVQERLDLLLHTHPAETNSPGSPPDIRCAKPSPAST